MTMETELRIEEEKDCNKLIIANMEVVPQTEKDDDVIFPPVQSLTRISDEKVADQKTVPPVFIPPPPPPIPIPPPPSIPPPPPPTSKGKSSSKSSIPK